MRKTRARRSSWSRASSPSASCPRKSEKLPRAHPARCPRTQPRGIRKLVAAKSAPATRKRKAVALAYRIDDPCRLEGRQLFLTFIHNSPFAPHGASSWPALNLRIEVWLATTTCKNRKAASCWRTMPTLKRHPRSCWLARMRWHRVAPGGKIPDALASRHGKSTRFWRKLHGRL